MLPENKVINGDCLRVMEKDIPDKEYNILYTDVPYNMNSRYVIDSSGHYRFSAKGSDFMDQWEAMDGLWWNKWFAQAYRILKPGGFLITHNIDRQSDLWTYYARRNNFFPLQKLYWLFIDNFPKGVDVGLAIDRRLGVEREVIGTRKGAQSESTGRYGAWGKGNGKGKASTFEETIATSELAKRYDGYKYGQAALKQVMEEILVFQKIPEGNTVSTILEHEEQIKRGRSYLHPPVFNIKGTLIPPRKVFGKPSRDKERWTPQLAVSKDVVPDLLNSMSHQDAADLTEPMMEIDYLEGEKPYNFCRKANRNEKDAGLHLLDEEDAKNIHPTPKPLNLCKWIVKLFTPPGNEEMKMLDPFCGQGSILVAADLAGWKWNGIEINEAYYQLALAKIEHYRAEAQSQGDLFNG